MRILAFNAYYLPEVAASLYLSSNLYEACANAGHQVDLFTPIPCRGISKNLRKEYSNRFDEIQCNGNLHIHRIRLSYEQRNVLLRAFRYILMNMLFIYKSFAVQTDMIFSHSTPPTQGAMAAIIAKLKGVPFVYSLQDVFPESLISTGLTHKNSLLWKLGNVIANFTYRNASKIIVISDDIKNTLLKKEISDNKIKVISNWVDIDLIKPIDKAENELYKKFQIDKNKFTIVYAGNYGMAQNVEIILHAAKKMENEVDIQFVLFGNGAEEANLKRIFKNLELTNVRMFPLQEPEFISKVYSMGDCCIVSCKKGTGIGAMPSKLWSIMSCGRAVLANFDSETDLQKIIVNNNAGLFSEAGDIEKLVADINYLYLNRKACEQMGANARIYVEENISKKKGTQDYIDIFEECTNSK